MNIHVRTFLSCFALLAFLAASALIVAAQTTTQSAPSSQNCQSNGCEGNPIEPQHNFLKITSTVVAGTHESVDCPLFVSNLASVNGAQPSTAVDPTCARLAGRVKEKAFCGVVVATPEGTIFQAGKINVMILQTNPSGIVTFVIAKGDVDASCNFDFLVSTRFADANSPPPGTGTVVTWAGLITVGAALGVPGWNACTDANICPEP